VQATLRRLKREKRRTPLKPRSESELDFVDITTKSRQKLLYDTTVYIDILQNRFPKDGDLTLRAAEAWHSPVTEAELTAAIGLLNPAHPETPEIVEQISDVIDHRPTHRTIVPDSEIWREAGVLSGILARLQGYGREHRRRLLNDALLFASARKHGCAVVTRNLVDFDFLQQLDPSGDVLFYR
jgi:predicted nucleic acid-binding protein